MITLHKQAQKAAQWIVDSVMGNGLAQQENAASGEGTVADAIATCAREAAAQGCVLLENDDVLPLRVQDEVAVYGRCQLDWFHMGYGSGGNVHPPYTTNLMDGLVRIGATHNLVLAEVYRSWCTSEEHEADHGFWGHWPHFSPEMGVSTELAQAAARTAHAAIIVIGRSAGEDFDLPLTKGGYYLTDAEKSLIETVTTSFERVVIVLNTSNVLDLAWVTTLKTKCKLAMLLAWQGGMEAGNAVADVLYGRANPSGRLASTIARSYSAYPSSTTFGSKGAVRYEEDVFVGYRHFLTRAPEDVLYPFGHGLSYTSFGISDCRVTRDDGADSLAVEALVTNTGSRAGREVVQLWCELAAGSLDKPQRVLVGFCKTGELAPGDTERVKLEVGMDCLASFDADRHIFVVEAGTYTFLANECEAGCVTLDEDLMVGEKLQPICSPEVDLRERILAELPAELERGSNEHLKFDDVLNGSVTLEEFVAQLTDSELEALTCGEGKMNSTQGVAGNAGALAGVNDTLRHRGIPAVICSDGPSGLRLSRYCSLLPCATALACTWNTQLVRELYTLVGQEAREAGVDMLLGPGMNIQRDPLCGRNFEYFSEDPLLTGRMAAAVVEGVQSQGVSACPKHFACNNQEMRRNTSDSQLSERALREIYLRGFQICVREAKPWAIMTSYNKINGVWAHYNYDLATTVLRNEWGFAGVVITDWWMRPSRSPEFPELRDNAYRVRAGVDVLMPGSMSHVLNVFEKPRGITRAELQRTALHVLGFCLLLAKR